MNWPNPRLPMSAICPASSPHASLSPKAGPGSQLQALKPALRPVPERLNFSRKLSSGIMPHAARYDLRIVMCQRIRDLSAITKQQKPYRVEREQLRASRARASAKSSRPVPARSEIVCAVKYRLISITGDISRHLIQILSVGGGTVNFSEGDSRNGNSTERSQGKRNTDGHGRGQFTDRPGRSRINAFHHRRINQEDHRYQPLPYPDAWPDGSINRPFLHGQQTGGHLRCTLAADCSGFEASRRDQQKRERWPLTANLDVVIAEGARSL